MERRSGGEMKYLFFDIECANCFDRKGKIFSFGYVLTDEKFNVIEPREDILVSPKVVLTDLQRAGKQ